MDDRSKPSNKYRILFTVSAAVIFITTLTLGILEAIVITPNGIYKIVIGVGWLLLFVYGFFDTTRTKTTFHKCTLIIAIVNLLLGILYLCF